MHINIELTVGLQQPPAVQRATVSQVHSRASADLAYLFQMDRTTANHARLQRSRSFGGFSPSAMQGNDASFEPAQSGDGDDEGAMVAPPSIASIHPAFQGYRSSASSRASESTFMIAASEIKTLIRLQLSRDI